MGAFHSTQGNLTVKTSKNTVKKANRIESVEKSDKKTFFKREIIGKNVTKNVEKSAVKSSFSIFNRKDNKFMVDRKTTQGLNQFQDSYFTL